jgi:hypothetical protein
MPTEEKLATSFSRESTSLDTRLPIALPGDNARIGIPPAPRRKRPSPAYDPLLRAQISRTAKWLMLAAILLAIVWFPDILYVSPTRLMSSSDPGNTDLVWLDPSLRSLTLIGAASIYATVIATGLPRLLFPGLFGKWTEAAEAMRDWLIVGVLTGAVYFTLVLGAHQMQFGPASGGTFAQWLMFRAPLLLLSVVIGLVVARAFAIRRDGVLNGGFGMAAAQIGMQALVLVFLEPGFERVFTSIPTTSIIVPLIGICALLCALSAVGVLSWAFAADSHLSTIRRRRGATGINDGVGPVSLTLTVIGGRESGKTVLMAAAFYEWSTQNIGNLRITPTSNRVTDSTAQAMENLEDVARELYVDNHFPVGTVSTQNLPFDLSLGQEKIASFTFLDYPGGAIAGRVADAQVAQDFWDRVDDTDGIVMIADMSYVRRATKDADWLEVRNAYRTVMQRIVDRNGKRRVVPVALVLTKCDEFIDPKTGRVDTAAIQAGLREFQYDELEAEWRRLNDHAGPNVVEFSTWITSAITYSQPQLGPDGKPDYKKPFEIAPPPPSLTPTGCASPLLWMTSKAMRWNVTLFYDLSKFIFGSTQRIRRRIEAVLELERIAAERAGGSE